MGRRSKSRSTKGHQSSGSPISAFSPSAAGPTAFSDVGAAKPVVKAPQSEIEPPPRQVTYFRTFLLHGGSALLIFLLATTVMTWPLASDGWGKIPGGLGDPLLNTWIHMWVYHALAQGRIAGLFDANIFYPAPKTLALSENMLTNQLIFAPAYTITKNPVFSYNLVLFLSFALGGTAMFALAYYWTRSYGSSLLAGFIYAFFPTRFAQIGHIQILSIYWAPMALLFLDRYLRWHTWRDLILLVGLAVLQIWASFYIGYFLMLILGIQYALYHVWHRIVPARRDVVGVLLILLLVFPLAYPYMVLNLYFGFDREISEVTIFSADLGKSFLSVPGENRLYGQQLARFAATHGAVEKTLFAGFLSPALVLVAIIRRRKTSGFVMLSSIIIILSAVILSLGPSLIWFEDHKFSPMPYQLLYDLVPGFSLIRVPARIMLLGMIPVSLLCAFAVQTKKRGGWIIAGLALTGVFTEYRVEPLSLTSVATAEHVPEVYRWLATQPTRGAVLELPAGEIYQECRYVYFSAYHFKPVINGYSGYFPQYYSEVMAELARPASIETLHYLQAIGVSTIVLHRDRLDPAPWDLLVRDGYLIPVARFGQDHVLTVDVKARPAALAVKGLQLDYVGADTDITAGLIVSANDGVWKKVPLEGARKMQIYWEGLGSRFELEGRLMLPLAVVGERWIGFKMRTPQTPGQYEISIRAGDIAVRQTVVVLEHGQDAHSGVSIDLKDHPTILRFSVQEEIGSDAADGNYNTCWATRGPQAPGIYFQVDLLREAEIVGLKLYHGPDVRNYPRGIRVFLSSDGQNWKAIANPKVEVMIKDRPRRWLEKLSHAFHQEPPFSLRDNFVTILWPTTAARFLRTELLGHDPSYTYPSYWWSIAEMHLLGSFLTSPLVNSASTVDLKPQIQLLDYDDGPISRAEVHVRNGGQAVWLKRGPSGIGSVRLASRWFSNGQEVWTSQRFDLPRALFPGEEATVDAAIERPTSSGRYLLRLDLVDEGLAWLPGGIEREITVP